MAILETVQIWDPIHGMIELNEGANSLIMDGYYNYSCLS